MELLSSLQAIGLTEKEAQVYMALLQLGVSSVYSIALKAGLKRPTTYVLVDELIKKGIVSQIPRVKKKLYQAKNPDELFAEAEGKLWRAKQRLPELTAMVRGQKYKPRVLFFEGLAGLKQTLYYGAKKMSGKEITGFYATAGKNTLKEFENFKDVNDMLKALGTKVRGVAPDDTAIEFFRHLDTAYGRKFKTISKEKYSPTVSIEMGDNYVKIQDFDNYQAVIIENENITKTLKQIFELVWDTN